MEDNKTWEAVKRTPGMRLLTSRWMSRKKSEADGSIRLKAKLVARGFLQRKGIDFSETYAPVARLPTLRIMIAPALQYQHYIQHLDVTTAFLYGDLEEVVNMAPPDGVTTPRKRKRKKDIDIKYQFLKELVSDGKSKLSMCLPHNRSQMVSLNQYPDQLIKDV